MEFSHVQVNAHTSKAWLLFDADVAGAWFLPEERGLPTPTYTAINPENTRAHFAYLLQAPVTFSANAREGPMKFYLAVERGFTRRLGADAGFSHHITKNPVHNRWIVDWQAKIPWRLDELNDVLEPHERRWEPKFNEGMGRNCTVFDTIRKVAYNEVLRFKREKRHFDDFRDFLKKCADDTNRTFPIHLWNPELSGIIKSVANWAWRTFTLEKFSAIQAVRSARRWGGKVTEAQARPWEKAGISRKTYYKRKKAGTLIHVSDMG